MNPTYRIKLDDLIKRICALQPNPFCSDRLKKLHRDFQDFHEFIPAMPDAQIRDTAFHLLLRLADECSPFFGVQSDVTPRQVRTAIESLMKRV